MMTASILAAFLAAAAGPAGNAAASGAPASASPGDEKITLNLRDADLKNLLEKLATVIGVTPIIAPGVGGTVTMSVSAPIPEILRSLERDFQITIRVADGRMFVTKPSAPPQALDEDAADLRTRADSSLPRRPAAAIPKRFEGAVEFWSGTGPSVVYSLAAPAGAISIPGCPSGFLLFTTPGDRFDGLPGLILKGSSILPRQFEPALEEAVSAEVPGCAGPLFVRLRASNAGAVAPVPLTPFGEFRIEVRILEVGAEGETVLSEPRLQVAGGEAAAIQSGSARRSPAGLTLEQFLAAL